MIELQLFMNFNTAFCPDPRHRVQKKKGRKRKKKKKYSMLHLCGHVSRSKPRPATCFATLTTDSFMDLWRCVLSPADCLTPIKSSTSQVRNYSTKGNCERHIWYTRPASDIPPLVDVYMSVKEINSRKLKVDHSLVCVYLRSFFHISR